MEAKLWRAKPNEIEAQATLRVTGAPLCDERGHQTSAMAVMYTVKDLCKNTKASSVLPCCRSCAFPMPIRAAKMTRARLLFSIFQVKEGHAGIIIGSRLRDVGGSGASEGGRTGAKAEPLRVKRRRRRQGERQEKFAAEQHVKRQQELYHQVRRGCWSRGGLRKGQGDDSAVRPLLPDRVVLGAHVVAPLARPHCNWLRRR